MRSPAYPTLFSPAVLGGVTVRNRVVMLPIAPRMTDDGRPSARDVAFYGARAEGGTGLIITGGTLAHDGWTSRSGGLWEAAHRENIPAFRRLVDAVHGHGCRIFGQLLHPGREPLSEIEAPLWAPSAVRSPTSPAIPHAMTASEIKATIGMFARSAANLLDAGYDGIELHGAHGFLLGAFFSPHANRRQDGFGLGGTQGLRVTLEIAQAVREIADPGAVLGIRISADEELPGGLEPDGAAQVARAISESKMFDYISVAVGINGTYVKDMATPQGVAVPLAARVRKASALPVLVSQRITEPAMAEEILRSGAADLIGMARAHIADAAWTAWAERGQPSRIVPCVGCLQECRTPVGGGVRCVHNPVSGRETSLPPLRRARRSKRVLVIGGGPAGLEAARVAAERGHSVALLEKDDALGGQARLAANAPSRGELSKVTDFRADELRRLDVDVRLGFAATPEAVLAEDPEAVVIATGAAVAGGEELPIEPGARMCTVFELLAGDGRLDDLLAGASAAVVLDDGSAFWDSVGAAELLAERGIMVTVVTPARHVGQNIPPESLSPLYRRLRRGGVAARVTASVERITRSGVRVIEHGLLSAASEASPEIPAQIVVRCGPRRPDDALFTQLADQVPEIYAAGDCLSPRRISQAVLEGHQVGRTL